MRAAIGAVVLALSLSGCADLRQAFNGDRIDTGDTLRFMVRLNTAEPPELAAIGDRLERRVGTDPSAENILRSALWQAVPGHAGFAPDSARRQLESLLADGAAFDDDARLLLRLQLDHLDERDRLRRSNEELAVQNRRLQQQIEDLTALERQMGEDEGNGN